ncbi:MAG: UPF0149 family protein [Candidatus Acidiferrum sp.]
MAELDEKPEGLDRFWDTNLETLGELLEQLWDDGAMDLEELDGFFTALHCCPELVLPSEYLPEVLGDGLENDELSSKPEVAELILGLILHHWNVVGDALDSEDFFMPLLLEDEESKSYGTSWAIGFLRGADMRKGSWKEILDDEENKAGWFVPIFALAYESDPDPKMHAYKMPMTEEQREKLLAAVSGVVTEMYRYFAPHRRQKAAEVIDQAIPAKQRKKIGRNDPCYCGSGKKYKKCCGGVKVN